MKLFLWNRVFKKNCKQSTWIPAFVTWLINKEITRHGWTREKKIFIFYLIIFFFVVSSHSFLLYFLRGLFSSSHSLLWWWRSQHYDFDHVIRIFFFLSKLHHITSLLSDMCSHFQCWSRKITQNVKNWQVNLVQIEEAQYGVWSDWSAIKAANDSFDWIWHFKLMMILFEDDVMWIVAWRS